MSNVPNTKEIDSGYWLRPFSFDGHGVNDSDGQRVCKVSGCDPYIYPDGLPVRNAEFDRLSNLFAAAPELANALQRAFNLIRESGFSSGLVEGEFDATLKQAGDALAKIQKQ